jgi:hypothetical protein
MSLIPDLLAVEEYNCRVKKYIDEIVEDQKKAIESPTQLPVMRGSVNMALKPSCLSWYVTMEKIDGDPE